MKGVILDIFTMFVRPVLVGNGAKPIQPVLAMGDMEGLRMLPARYERALMTSTISYGARLRDRKPLITLKPGVKLHTTGCAIMIIPRRNVINDRGMIVLMI